MSEEPQELGWRPAAAPWTTDGEAEAWADANESRPSAVEELTEALAAERRRGRRDD